MFDGVGTATEDSTIVESSMDYEKSTIVDFSENEVEEEEKNFFYFCGKQQEYAAYRRRSVGRLHRGRAWRAFGIASPVEYFKDRLGLGKARYHRLVQNDQTERELISRVQNFDFSDAFVKDSFLEALRDYTHGQQLVIVTEIHKRRRFFTQKELTLTAECLGFKKLTKKYGFTSSNSKEEGTQLELLPLEEEDMIRVRKVAVMDDSSDVTTICKAVRIYTRDRLSG